MKRDFWKYEAIARGDIAKRYSWCVRELSRKEEEKKERRERNRFISALRNKRKKKKSIRLSRVYRFTRSIGNKFI